MGLSTTISDVEAVRYGIMGLSTTISDVVTDRYSSIGYQLQFQMSRQTGKVCSKCPFILHIWRINPNKV